MKIYTKTGDDGTTGFFGGGRVRKDDPRIACYGTVDELNACLGLAAAAVEIADAPGVAPLLPQLRQVQSDLFLIGSYLATPDAALQSKHLPPLNEEMTLRLESEIDAAEAQMPPLQNFILPGGSELSARLHLARTICRRAERMLIALEPSPALPEIALRYLNRLSDWCFVQARWSNHQAGVADIRWRAGGVQT